MSGDYLKCDVCGQAVAPDDFVGLDRLDDNRVVVVVKRGAQVGDMIGCDIWACTSCVMTKGKRVGRVAIGTDS